MKIWIIILILLFPATLHAEEKRPESGTSWGDTIFINDTIPLTDKTLLIPKSKYNKIVISDDWESWKVTAKVRK